MAVLYDRSVTWRAGRRDGQQDRVADRLHDAVRRHAPARSTRSATCTRARSASWRPRSASRTRSPQGAVGRPVARPDRRGRGRVQLPGARSAPVLADRQAALDRRDGRARVRRRDGRARRPDGRRRRVQAPGAADRQARAADGGRRLPVPAPPAGLGARRMTGDSASAVRAIAAGAGGIAVRRRHADRQPRRRHAARARGPARRPADRRRGHAAHAPAAGRATASRRG